MSKGEGHDGQSGIDEGRRKLIKAAAIAGGAAVAVGALPGEWKKPLATVGGLPAHAQTSGQITIASLNVSLANGIAPGGDAALANGGGWPLR